MLKMLVLLALPLIAALIWLTLGIARIGAVSTGPKIKARTGTALLLVDLQTVFWKDGPYSAEEKARAERFILAEIDAARAQGMPVIALRQEWSLPATKVLARLTMKGQAIEGTKGTELAAPFRTHVDHEIVKRVQDGFETGVLDTLLDDLNIGKLRIVGLDGQYCITKTTQGALARGYTAHLLMPGILSAAPDKAKIAIKTTEANGATLIDYDHTADF